MSSNLLKVFTLLMLSSFCLCITNLQLRGCIDQVTEEEHGVCYKQLRECFSTKECGHEFTLLFNDCQMPLDDKDMDSECFLKGQKRIEHPNNLELTKCFDEVCGMFGGVPSANLEEIEQNIMATLEEKKAEYEQRKSKSETEEFLCVKQALTDPEKCYKLADDCDEDCSYDLNKLKSCKADDTNDCIYDIDSALPKLVNEKAIQLTTCLHKLCYQDNSKNETANTQENAEVIEEL